jgi:hypothetical protein
MSNKQVVILVVVLVVLGVACIVLAGPALMNMIRGIHVIPPH